MSMSIKIDDLVAQATRCLDAIRITVRKEPEVLVLETKETVMADWLFVRICAVLLQDKNQKYEGLKSEIVRTLADVFRMWKEANPKSWSDRRKCTENIKSHVTCTLIAVFC